MALSLRNVKYRAEFAETGSEELKIYDFCLDKTKIININGVLIQIRPDLVQLFEPKDHFFK